MIWADYAILAAMPLLFVGGLIEGLAGQPRLFIKSLRAMILINVIAVILLIAGLIFQEFPEDRFDGWDIITAMQLAIERVIWREE